MRSAHTAGAGARGLPDWFGSAVIYAGLALGSGFWSTWAMRNGLPAKGIASERLPLILIAGLVTTALHELGHVLSAIVLDMRVRNVVLGPLSLSFEQGHWQFRFSLKQIFSAGGSVSAVPMTMDEFRWRQMLVSASGPVASLGVAAFGFLITVNLPGSKWGANWLACSYVATYSLLEFVVNMMPMRPEGMYADGTKMYQLLSGGAAAKVEEALASVSSSLVAPVRPRDWDADLLATAARHSAGKQAVLLRLHVISAHFDAGRSDLARAALEEAENSYLRFAAAIPEPDLQIVHESLTFYTAILRQSATCARAWWNRTTWQRTDGWTSEALRSHAALLWLEGRSGEAERAWADGNSIAESCPKTGTYDYVRDCFARLRESAAAVAA